MEEHRLNICTFNCRSVKSSLNELSELCEHSDLVLLQEHWLLPFEIDCLNTVHKDFLSRVHVGKLGQVTKVGHSRCFTY